MKRNLDMEKIANELGAKRAGKVGAKGGYFGALDLASEVASRFRVPDGGGRATDPGWTEQRLVRLAPKTLKRLEHLTQRLDKEAEVRITPLQLAALLIEKASEKVSDEDLTELVAERARR